MHFRYARHTNQLAAITSFYTEVIGLSVIGQFKDHDGYDGVFLGKVGVDWHVEFTSSASKAIHTFDEDDFLVFYLHSRLERLAILQAATKAGSTIIEPKNPYWRENAFVLADPDGASVCLALKHAELTATDPTTQLILAAGITNWDQLTNHVKLLPYGRNSNRHQPELVISEGRGSCSSKHALLKQVADLNEILGVELILGVYKMNTTNTPKIGDALVGSGLDFVPEAHCYIKINNKRIDLTTTNARIDLIEADLLEEIAITPDQVVQFKVDFHRDFMHKWIAQTESSLSFDEVWAVRERCIEQMSR
jgi:catechol 2,3-dioxygenase-like lactoylglutathione lyase family enzyme